MALIERPKPGKDHMAWAIQEITSIYGDRFIFPDCVINNTGTSKITLICKISGDKKISTLCGLLNIKNRKSPSCCKTCGTEASNSKRTNKKRYTHATFLEYMTKLFGDQFTFTTQFQGTRKSISAHCKYCDVIITRPARSFTEGNGCNNCFKITPKEFIDRANKIHNFAYTYIESYTLGINYINILCNRCDRTFNQQAHAHLNGRGCPRCHRSKGEIEIERWLMENDIDYEEQYRFKDCVHKQQLVFDFYLKQFNAAIEFNGRQHYMPVIAFGGEKGFKEVQERDAIKREYCEENGINLIIIKFIDTKDQKLPPIAKILTETFIEYGYIKNTSIDELSTEFAALKLTKPSK
jgi:hypothetical protein